MGKKTVWLVIIVSLVALGGFYLYSSYNKAPNEYNGMFVDKEDDNGYAKVYDLLKNV